MRELAVERVGAEERDVLAANAAGLELGEHQRDRDRPDRRVAGHRRVVEGDRHAPLPACELAQRWQILRPGQRVANRSVEVLHGLEWYRQAGGYDVGSVGEGDVQRAVPEDDGLLHARPFLAARPAGLTG